MVIDKFGQYINKLYASLREVHRITKKQTLGRNVDAGISPSYGPRLVPHVSAGRKPQFDMDAESLLISSDSESEKEYDQLTERTQD